MMPPEPSGRSRRVWRTWVYVVRCNAMDRSNAPGMDASASPPLNRSGDPQGPAARPRAMSKGVPAYQSLCHAKSDFAVTGLDGFTEKG